MAMPLAKTLVQKLPATMLQHSPGQTLFPSPPLHSQALLQRLAELVTPMLDQRVLLDDVIFLVPSLILIL